MYMHCKAPTHQPPPFRQIYHFLREHHCSESVCHRTMEWHTTTLYTTEQWVQEVKSKEQRARGDELEGNRKYKLGEVNCPEIPFELV